MDKALIIIRQARKEKHLSYIRLPDLLRQAQLNLGTDVPDIPISGLFLDSRDVKPGGLFFALRGQLDHGLEHIAEAISRGAVACFSDQAFSPQSIPAWVLPSLRQWVGALADAFYGHPSQDMYVIGVTGTNGKTTVAHLIEHLLNSSHRPCGNLGTVQYRWPGTSVCAGLTTPDAISIHRYLHEMKAAQVKHAVMECSSQALHQARLNAVAFDAAIFTQLSAEHLDYHASLAEYERCKRMLFTEVLAQSSKVHKIAVINWDDATGRSWVKGLAALFSVVTFSRRDKSDLQALGTSMTQDGLQGSLAWRGTRFDFHSHLVGSYNLENVLAAVAVALEMGLSRDQVVSGLASFAGVPGRLQSIANSKNTKVFIDYAHTPDALENVLRCLLSFKHPNSRLIVVFGCGGDRDRSKRPKMVQLALAMADEVILTSDNPRHEDPQQIFTDMTAGVNSESYCLIEDRKLAIYKSLDMARPEDMVLIAGKGHETYQLVKGVKIAFDEAALIRAYRPKSAS